MENQVPENVAPAAAGTDTPEDVAVLYSWANLQGAKYRDFSASRREYRAQMRLRAAEEQRTEEQQALAEAEAAAAEAEKAAREAEEAALLHETAARRAAEAQERKTKESAEAAGESARMRAEELTRIAAAERGEAARRAQGVAAAEASRRREEREMEEARASAERQAARYIESEARRRQLAGPQPEAVPGQITDPYSNVMPVAPAKIFQQPQVEDDMLPSRHPQTRTPRMIVPQPDPEHPQQEETELPATGSIADDAALAARGTDAVIQAAARQRAGGRRFATQPSSAETVQAVDHVARALHRSNPRGHQRPEAAGSRSSVRSARDAEDPPVRAQPFRSALPPGLDTSAAVRVASIVSQQPSTPAEEPPRSLDLQQPAAGEASSSMRSVQRAYQPPPVAARPAPPAPEVELSPLQGFGATGTPLSPAPEARNRSAEAVPAPRPPSTPARPEAPPAMRRIRGYQPDEASGFFSAYGSARAQAVAVDPQAPIVPAWLNGPAGVLEQTPPSEPSRISSDPRRRQVSSGNTPVAPVEALQHSRERVAARWFALKGVFDHGVEELRAAEQARREREGRAPMLAVFSLAGGVGKTSIVATLGRTLSSTGEKVLLTDTTSHGLLPFYFGASELRPGVVRTFSPPSGSADAPIYLLSYDVLQKTGDNAAQDWLASEIAAKSKGMSRVVLDVSAASPWVARKLARMDATVLVPLAPDMNAVISLGAMEKFFSEMKDTTGKKVEPFYMLNQFDPSLALHLDVREVLRRQLDDRLLPFVIRRASAVPESLAEGMTVFDYATDSAVAEDFRSLCSWLKERSAPLMATAAATRWSER